MTTRWPPDDQLIVNYLELNTFGIAKTSYRLPALACNIDNSRHGDNEDMEICMINMIGCFIYTLMDLV